MKKISEFKWGIILGLLWTLEISVNNFFHPPLPGRDIFDDIIWAVIGIVILIVSTITSINAKKMVTGIKTGFWLGLGSGFAASVTALLFATVGIKFILSDPLVIEEWAGQAATQTMGMQTYFVYQTLAGAFLHLVVLGIGMGAVLGLLGGLIGKILKICKSTNWATNCRKRFE